jgi:heat shock protein HslJ
MRKIIVGLVTAADLVLSGCAILPDDRYDSNWILTYGKNSQGTFVNGAEGAIRMTINAGQISGHICNSWGGDISITNTSVLVSGIYSTEMWCTEPEGIMDRETRFLNDLSRVTSVEIVDGTLHLSGGPVTLDFVAGD